MECHKWRLLGLSTAPLGLIMSITFICPYIDPSSTTDPQSVSTLSDQTADSLTSAGIQIQNPTIQPSHQLDWESWHANAHMVLVLSLILEAVNSLFTCIFSKILLTIFK